MPCLIASIAASIAGPGPIRPTHGPFPATRRRWRGPAASVLRGHAARCTARPPIATTAARAAARIRAGRPGRGKQNNISFLSNYADWKMAILIVYSTLLVLAVNIYLSRRPQLGCWCNFKRSPRHSRNWQSSSSINMHHHVNPSKEAFLYLCQIYSWHIFDISANASCDLLLYELEKELYFK